MVGAALECVHCYSLVHDDLPRWTTTICGAGGPPRTGVRRGECYPGGDGLLTLAFDVLARPETHSDPGRARGAYPGAGRAAGLGGMVGGQMLDLAAEGRFADGTPERLDEARSRRCRQ